MQKFQADSESAYFFFRVCSLVYSRKIINQDRGIYWPTRWQVIGSRGEGINSYRVREDIEFPSLPARQSTTKRNAARYTQVWYIHWIYACCRQVSEPATPRGNYDMQRPWPYFMPWTICAVIMVQSMRDHFLPNWYKRTRNESAMSLKIDGESILMWKEKTQPLRMKKSRTTALLTQLHTQMRTGDISHSFHF